MTAAEAGPTAEERSELETRWEAISRAAESATPLRVRIVGPDEIDAGGERVRGLRVAWGPVSGFLHGLHAPWASSGTVPEEADAWVLRFDLDRGIVVFIAFDPRTGPA